MAKWTFEEQRREGGLFQIVITKLLPGGKSVDVTEFRDAPVLLQSFSDADPFGDAAASISFPMITPFDDLKAPELVTWLDYYSNVDIYWVPTIPDAAGYDGEPLVMSAMTNRRDVIAPISLRSADGVRTADNRVKVWEGFIASFDWDSSGGSSGLTISCQGAIFQNDRYLAKPFFPPQPWPLELLIADVFDRTKKPHLRTQPLRIEFPQGWKLVVPPYTANTVFTPVAKPGTKWSGYTSRQTGSWDHALTGFVQDQLSVMLTDDRSGVPTGNQWTVQHVHQGPDSAAGRQPVLLVRDRFRAPDFEVWLGTPGITMQLAGDSTQSENVVYGDGTNVDGTVWRNAVISNDGTRTDYLPLAAAPEIYPYIDPHAAATAGKPSAFMPGAFASEAYTKYGTGFDQPSAVSASAQALARDREPGLSGTITMTVDPSADLPRWLVRAGMTVRVKGLLGTGERGYPLHISATEKDIEQGSVTLTVDSRYRDLLTVEESLQRTRDPLTPVKMLQVNRTSVLIEDIQAPWDYAAGSGYVPKTAQAFFQSAPTTTSPFPYSAWTRANPPLSHGSYYVKVSANAGTRAQRWAGPVPILTSEKDTIIRTEFVACDINGNRLKVPFHVSLYYVNVTSAAMPRDGQGPSPYIDGAFESVNPATGQPWPAGNFLAPDPSMIIGWGNRSQGVYNRAGFWPARESDGAGPSGLFVDEAAWSFDNTNNPNYNKLAKPGQKQSASAITIYAMFYCEWTQPVYFIGRLFRQNPGSG